MNSDGPTVVVADDDEDILTLVGTVLRRAGFTVVEARDGEQALARIAERRPRAVVLDVAMPQLDGLEVVRRLRADPATADLPIVLLSARAQEADVRRGYDQGASQYVRKPFKPADLVAAVEELVGQGR